MCCMRQIWRLVTPFFLNRLGLAYAMNLYFIYRYSSQLENEVFLGRTADYLYFHIVSCALQLVNVYLASLLFMDNC